MLFLIPIPSILIWIGVVLSALAFAFGLLLLFAALSAALASVAMVFSRISFALFVAFAISQGTALLGLTGFTNFIAWAAITLIITFLLCKFPRIGQAVGFLASFLISFLILSLAVCLVMGIIVALCGGSFNYSAPYRITVLVISALFGAFAFLKAMANADSINNVHLKKPLLVNIERIIASFIYGLVLMMIAVISIEEFVSVPVFVQWILVAGFGLAAFLVDIILPRTPLMDKVKNISFAVGKEPVSKEESRSRMIDKLK